MSRYQIVDCKPVHLSMVARRLRPEDRDEILAMGMQPRHLLYTAWRTSAHRWAAFVDGEIALVGGCAGMMLSSVGEAWLYTTPAIERVPMAFAKEAGRWLRMVLEEKSTITTSCISTYKQSLRFWQMLGFANTGEIDINGHSFRRLVLERGHGN